MLRGSGIEGRGEVLCCCGCAHSTWFDVRGAAAALTRSYTSLATLCLPVSISIPPYIPVLRVKEGLKEGLTVADFFVFICGRETAGKGSRTWGNKGRPTITSTTTSTITAVAHCVCCQTLMMNGNHLFSSV